jgi:hypothetical protein
MTDIHATPSPEVTFDISQFLMTASYYERTIGNFQWQAQNYAEFY